MKKIGITGGIGSGKSVVSCLFRVMGVPVYDADSASKSILISNIEVKSRLSRLLGGDIYDAEGNLLRKKMASMIFSDEKLMAGVNEIVHPAVISDFECWSRQQKCKIVACESALIYESKMNAYIDYVLMVFAPLEMRVDRACRRDSSSRDSIYERIKNQMSDEEKMRLSDFIIYNDGVRAILPQVWTLFSSLEE